MPFRGSSGFDYNFSDYISVSEHAELRLLHEHTKEMDVLDLLPLGQPIALQVSPYIFLGKHVTTVELLSPTFLHALFERLTSVLLHLDSCFLLSLSIKTIMFHICYKAIISAGIRKSA